MNSITEKLWTRVTPWTVTVSPLEDPDMPEVLEFARAEDAREAVVQHNAYLGRVYEA